MDSIYSTHSSDSGETDLTGPFAGRLRRRNLSASTRSLVQEDDMDWEEGMVDNVKLKGIIWPGMDLFDSATSDMRRKRNQKKATSVLAQLQATSAVVGATELVFDEDGVLRRERPITGNPEERDGRSPLPGESSPEPESQPPKKRGGRRPRAALTKRNVNTGRPRRSSRRDANQTRFGRTTRRAPYFHGADEDDEMTYGTRIPKRRTGLSIHRDNTGPEITFDHPAPMSTLTAGFRTPFPPIGTQSGLHASYHVNGHPRGHRRQPSFPLSQGFRPTQSNPLGLAPPPNFGSFGQLTSASLFQNTNFHSSNPFPVSTGPQAAAAFQQQFGLAAQSFGGDSFAFQAAPTHSQTQPTWDLFSGFGAADLDLHNTTDVNFPVAGEFGSVMNPLFISSNHVAPEDDEATVSPPSEH